MKKRGRKPVFHNVTLEVLQNGEVQDRYSQTLKRNSSIRISNKAGAQLRIPSFRFSRPIEICRIKKTNVLLQPDSSWAGYIYTNGSLVDLNSPKAKLQEYTLKSGDRASIQFLGLEVLIKIGPNNEVTKKSVKLDKGYRGNIGQLFFPERTDRLILGISIVAAGILFGGFIYGLLVRPDTRPRGLFDLRPEYVLPFVHKDHIETLPEAMQGKLNRKNTLKSLANHYTKLALSISGRNPEEDANSLLPISGDRLKEMHSRQRELLEAQNKNQFSAISKEVGRPGVGVLAVPVIRGESYFGQVARTVDKLKIYHKGLNSTLELRRSITKDFRQDPEYNFGDYKSMGKSTKNDSHAEIGKIGAFGLKTDEDTMYMEAKQLAQTAQKIREKIDANRANLQHLTQSEIAPIGIAAIFPTVDYREPENFVNLDQKIEHIPASIPGSAKGEVKAKEPLIGEIDPQLIEEIISNKRFELQLCFELALRRNQLLNGRMIWQWRLDTRGQLTDLELLSSSIGDPNMISCVKSKIASWKFPRPRRGSVQIKYPLVFEKSRG